MVGNEGHLELDGRVPRRMKAEVIRRIDLWTSEILAYTHLLVRGRSEDSIVHSYSNLTHFFAEELL